MGDALGAVAADANQAVQAERVNGSQGRLRHIPEYQASSFQHGKLVRISLLGGAQYGAAPGEDAGNIVRGQVTVPVVDQPEVAVFNADYFQSVIEDGAFNHGPDNGIDARAIAAAGQDANPISGNITLIPQHTIYFKAIQGLTCFILFSPGA